MGKIGKMTRGIMIVGILALVLLAACQDDPIGGSTEMKISVLADGTTTVYTYNRPISVGQFLQERGFVLGPDDEVNPLLQTQLRDNLRITITRVSYELPCENIEEPYDRIEQPTQSLSPGESQILQAGQNGITQVCYRITLRDGVESGAPIEISRVPIQDPRDEIVQVGRERPNTLIAIDGVLTYISNGQAWIIEGIAANQRPVTAEGFLDGRVFDLSADGQRLLYTQFSDDESDLAQSNELWAILDTGARVTQQVTLGLIDVRTAQWIPDQRTPTVSYSTFTPQSSARGYDALNDLYVMELDPVTGEILEGPDPLIPTNSWGRYAFWGRRLKWSPDGTQLAWANADSVGVVDLEATGDDLFVPILTFAEFGPLLELLQGTAVWVPTLSWSPDGHIITTLHGDPYGEEQPEDSIVFDLAVTDVNSGLIISEFFSQVGIWSLPTYSPSIAGLDGSPTYLIAYFQARDRLRSPGAEYDLWIADRDGSNARRVFPDPSLPGLRSPDPEDGIAWSPTGRQIALIHQGNLWIIDVATGQATQVTDDGQASHPRWSSQ